MGYLCQAPKEWDAQSAKFRKAHPNGWADLERDRYFMQPKYDGCHLILYTGDYGNCEGARAFSRTNEPVRSCDHILQAAIKAFGPGWYLFGEAYQFDTPFPEISGKFRRHNPEPDLIFAAFDIVTQEAWKMGHSTVPYAVRFQGLTDVLRGRPQPCIFRAAIEPLDPLADPSGFAVKLKEMGGYDGAVVRDMNAGWKPGAAKDGEVIKVKPVMSLDLLVVGVEEGEGKLAGMMGKINVTYNGVVTGVGTGFDNKERKWWHTVDPFAHDIIVEVEFMGFTEDGKLREPRFKGIRHDKEQAD